MPNGMDGNDSTLSKQYRPVEVDEHDATALGEGGLHGDMRGANMPETTVHLRLKWNLRDHLRHV